MVRALRAHTFVCQAFTNPAALCALSRIVPPQNRATVNGAYSSAVYFGGGLAALSVLIDGQIGWRGLSYLAGGVGLALALLTYVVLPPLPPADTDEGAAAGADAGAGTGAGAGADAGAAELAAAESGGADGGAVAPAAAGLGELLGDPLVRALLVASGLRFMGGFTLGVWIVPFYRSAFPGEIGTEFALLKVRRSAAASTAYRVQWPSPPRPKALSIGRPPSGGRQRRRGLCVCGRRRLPGRPLGPHRATRRGVAPRDRLSRRDPAVGRHTHGANAHLVARVPLRRVPGSGVLVRPGDRPVALALARPLSRPCPRPRSCPCPCPLSALP